MAPNTPITPITQNTHALRRTLTLALGTSAILAACSGVQTAAQPSVNLEARRAELLEANRAAQARTTAGRFVDEFSNLFAPTGTYVVPGVITGHGPAQARAWLQRDTLNATSAAAWHIVRLDLSADGRDAYAYGYFDVYRAAGDTMLGRFQAYWRRSDAGQWQIQAFSRARRPPGKRTETAPASYAPATPRWWPMRDSVEAFRAVAATEGAFCDSAATNVGAAFAAFAAPDVSKPGPESEFVFGRAAVQALFAGAPAGGGPLWRPEAGTVAKSNDLAFTFGPAWPRQSGLKDPPATAGRYFTVWRRQADGTWRYVVD